MVVGPYFVTICNTPNPKASNVNIFLNSGVKRAKLRQKTNHFLGLKPYIRSLQ